MVLVDYTIRKFCIHPVHMNVSFGFSGVRLGGGALQCEQMPHLHPLSMAGTLTEAVVAGLEHVIDWDRVSGSRT